MTLSFNFSANNQSAGLLNMDFGNSILSDNNDASETTGSMASLFGSMGSNSGVDTFVASNSKDSAETAGSLASAGTNAGVETAGSVAFAGADAGSSSGSISDGGFVA